jgi:hydantoinase/carbamoylase family amidase
MEDPPYTDSVDLDRMQRRLDEIMSIGKTEEGGVTRLAYSEEESEAFEYVRSELDNSLEIRTDSLGNLYASPDLDSAETTLVGSHLDSVYNGGRLDGALGVVVAMEAMDVVETAETSSAVPPTLVVFRGEESARFGSHTIGSRGALGMLTVEDFSRADQNDVPLWLAMQRDGHQPSDLSEPMLDLSRVRRFYETHIEQGRVLDESDNDLGIVTSIRAPVRYNVTVEGAYDHSGATPMDLREDALAAAGEMITAVEQVASDTGAVVATVGDITARDGAINKVCGEVAFPLDIRSDEVPSRDEVERGILNEFSRITDRRDVTVSKEEIDRSDPVSLSKNAIDELTDAVSATGAEYLQLPSGGGHDAMNFQQAGIPTGMLFVPSVRGISHSPEEETYPESIRSAAIATAHVLANPDA